MYKVREHAADNWRVQWLQKMYIIFILRDSTKRPLPTLVCPIEAGDSRQPVDLDSLIFVKTKSSSQNGEILGRELLSGRMHKRDWCMLKETDKSFPSQAIHLVNGLSDRIRFARDREYRSK